MIPIVSLKAVVEEMDVLSDEHHAYLYKHTGKLITISNEEIDIVEQGNDIDDYPGWQQGAIRKAVESVRLK